MYTLSSSSKEHEGLLSQPPMEAPPDERRPAWYGNLRSLSLRVIAWRCLVFLKPSFLGKSSPSSSTPEQGSRQRKRYATEYLDGVRGVASLIVFIFHWSHMSFPSVNSGWGYQDNGSFWLLPFVRLIFSGASMVAVFFVISGFVLSHRFIQRMHRQEYPELFSGLTSLTFRRAIRLFIPAFTSSTVAFICACLRIITVPGEVNGKRFKNGFRAYIAYLDLESNFWDWQPKFNGFYNPQLWSIAVEFRGSMVVFLLLLGLAQTRTPVRLIVETTLIAHCFGHRRWDVALFIAGMVLAELEVLLEKPANASRKRLVNLLLVSVLLVGLFLSGYPRDHSTDTPGYMWSKYVWPFTAYRRRYWLAIGAILIVGPLAFLPPLQSVFLTRPARYLGRISFALYLVHGLGNRTVGGWLLETCWTHIGRDKFWSYTISFVVSTILYFPIVIWASDLFWRAVDVPSTDLARWFEKKCAVK
ncbi:acyltransferase family-domain-containing protein [Biscogniauxia mediterranea]|nr:acyltransferase family-domain-containing protein [Biscogniauxia mediterranea]